MLRFPISAKCPPGSMEAKLAATKPEKVIGF
jgi:hypothetical protein